MKWQPIETAPKDGTLILATGWKGGKVNTSRNYVLCQYNKSCEGFFNFSEWLGYGFLTHWMPLPDSPEDQQQFSGGILHPPV